MVLNYIILVLSISVRDVQSTPLLKSDMFKEFLPTDSPKYWFNYVRKFLHRNIINLILEYYEKQKYFDFHFIHIHFKRTQIFKQLATDVIQYDRKCNKTWEKRKETKVESVLFLSTPIRSIIDNISIIIQYNTV